MVLKFGKFKGERLEDTPKWYREWLLKQDWFEQENVFDNNIKHIYDKVSTYEGGLNMCGLAYLCEGMYVNEYGEIVDEYGNDYAP